MSATRYAVAALLATCIVAQAGAEVVILSDNFAVEAKIQKVTFTFGDPGFTGDAMEYRLTEGYKNHVIAGVKAYKGDIFLTIPRWSPGVLSTLNQLVYESGVPTLKPWPSWAWQEAGNCSMLQYVQSMEIDSEGVMWIIDASDVFGNYEDENMKLCPPKVVLIDVASATEVGRYDFPSDVVPVGSFLNDIVVDETNQVAYISDLNGGQIVVYDREGARSKVWADDSAKGQPTDPIVIQNTVYPSGPAPGAGVDGIALEPCGKYVYYCTLQGTQLFRVDAGKLRDFSASDQDIKATVWQTEKPGMADGMTFDENGVLYMAAISNSTAFHTQGSAIYSYNPATDTWRQEARDSLMLHWGDTFAFDEETGDLLVTANRLDLFFNDPAKFWDPTENTAEYPNLHVIRIPVEAKSYMSGRNAARCSPQDDGATKLGVVWTLGIALALTFLSGTS